MTEPERTTVSYSEIAAARQCKLKHKISYDERWTKPDLGGPRSLGTAFHLVAQAHMTELQAIQRELTVAGQAPATHPFNRWTYPDGTAERLHQAVHTTDVFSGEHAEIVAWMYEGWLERWGLRTDWTILAVEFAPVSWLPDLDGQPSRFDLKCKIDLVVQQVSDGLIWLIDWKTGQRRPQPAALNLEDQFGLYTWILRRLGRQVHGAIHSWAKTTQPKTFVDKIVDRFQDYPMDRSDYELDRIARDAFVTVDRTYRAIEAGEVEEVYPDGEWCKRRCDFVNAHLADRRGFTTMRAYLADTGWSVDKTRH